MLNNEAILYTRKKLTFKTIKNFLFARVGGIYFAGKVYHSMRNGIVDVLLEGWIEEQKRNGLKVFYKNIDGTKGSL